MSEPLIIWGCGGHALVVADLVRKEGRFQIAGFIDETAPERAGESFAGAKVLGGREQLAALRAQGVHHLLPGFGDPLARLRLIDLAEEHGFTLATAAHPASVLAGDVALGAGSVAVAGAIVNPAATIGRAVILNTACSVDHHCEIGDAAHIAPGARLAGRVRVGRGAWVGIGAVVREGITIGEHTIVGAGAVVIRDLPAGVIVAGNPARVLKENPRAPRTA